MVTPETAAQMRLECLRLTMQHASRREITVNEWLKAAVMLSEFVLTGKHKNFIPPIPGKLDEDDGAGW